MNRFFLTNEISDNKITKNSEPDFYHHLVDVLRARPGKKIELVSQTELYDVTIENVDEDAITFNEIEKKESHSELPIDVTIVVSNLKSDHTDFLIQKSTELGVSKIIITNFKNTVAKIKDDKKIQRYQKIVQNAAEQSKRLKVPEVEIVNKLSQIDFSQYETKIVAYEESAKNGEKNQLVKSINNTGHGLVAIFGPEGGIDPDEIDSLKQAGFVLAGLGPRILRAETAPLYLLSAVSYQKEMN
ncbi:MAG: 16S rRNA (uracil(1498)-N(3))-methyltransferase [Lactobacillaceae bacterium]|nr:16S rRNA (uracil(1498)-N(3))-methyltransferase [Lactobacillaceae bacterium]